jgi:hypothetical protein
MWMHLLFAAPYLAIAASGLLAFTVAMVCYLHPTLPSGRGFMV